MPIVNRIADYHAELTAWRQDLHRHPETAFEEHRTAKLVAERLRGFGVDEVHAGIAKTGVVGVIRGRGNASGRAIGLRADMDALHVTEITGAPYASTVPGKMHACGHDGHTTMLLGAARYLAETRNFDGTIYVIFQPAEENEGGGRVMVEEGLFARFPMDRVYGLHNWPGLPAGHFAIREGNMMAAVANVEIRLAGKGAHGAMPHLGIDPVLIAAHIVTALQSIVSRNADPCDPAVVTISMIQGGDTWNVIPQTLLMRGTTRWFDKATGDLLEKRVPEVAKQVAAAFGAVAEVDYMRAYPATINDPVATGEAMRAAKEVAGADKVHIATKPTMGAEDFAFLLNAKQGAYIFMGTGRTPHDPMCHHPGFDFNDAMIPLGASYWVRLAEQMLPRQD